MEPFPRSFSLAGKRGVVDDVGALAAFMASDAAALITGGTLHVDGGYHILG